MRRDSLGMFWFDKPPEPKAKAEKIKCTPPEPTWLDESYLPGLEEARAFNLQLMSDWDIQEECRVRNSLIVDIECYINYFLVGFVSYQSGKVAYFEMKEGQRLDYTKLSYILHNFNTIGFNSLKYDIPMITLALAGYTCEELKMFSDGIIVNEERPADILRGQKVKKLRIDHIDIMEVAPLRASLKVYGGRVHVPAMQDLPFHPSVTLNEDQIAIVRWYCLKKDLTNTAYLKSNLEVQLDLRVKMSNEYKIDLRSRSDAQIAESVIAQEIEKLNSCRPMKPNIPPGTVYHYNVPHFMQFKTPLMQWALNVVKQTLFIVEEDGKIGLPHSLKNLKLQIGESFYKLGIGGLHSSEKKVHYIADSNTLLIDRDVTSYYPFIILNQNLFPSHLGPNFILVYKKIVERRLAAKARGDSVVAETLKILINGSYGKLGQVHSVLYAPQLLIQVTLTGQLSVLMLIERLELAGIPVVSANTDGFVIKCPKSHEAVMNSLVDEWEKETGLQTEASNYLALYSRDVNNYIAIKAPTKKSPEITVKGKGVYARPGLSKNPQNEVCIDAIENLLIKGIPIRQTVLDCKDIRKFINVRKVKGGAVKISPDKPNEYLGESIRWYYGADEPSHLVYAKTGKKVPRSNGAVPVMDLPAQFPDNIDYNWYIVEAEAMMRKFGYG